MKRFALAALIIGLVLQSCAPAVETPPRSPAAVEFIALTVKHYKRLAEQGDPDAALSLGIIYFSGWQGVEKNEAQAAHWFRRAAEQDNVWAQTYLGVIYYVGEGVRQDFTEAARWTRKAANRGHPWAQVLLGEMYYLGLGVGEDPVRAYMWLTLASWRSESLPPLYSSPALEKYYPPEAFEILKRWFARDAARELEATRGRAKSGLSPAELAEAEKLAREWKPRSSEQAKRAEVLPEEIAPRVKERQGVALRKQITGSGFTVSLRGHVLTNRHVVEGCTEVHVRTGDQTAVATRTVTDRANDLAVVETAVAPAAVASFRTGRGIRPGDSVVAIGFPLRGLLASEANVTMGNVSALAGPGDTRSLLQITAPIQPGSSGGPLLDMSGNVVGVMVAKLDALKVARVTGDIPQNVNFAINASVARIFLDAEGIEYKLATSTKTLSGADVAARARKFTVVIECWR